MHELELPKCWTGDKFFKLRKSSEPISRKGGVHTMKTLEKRPGSRYTFLNSSVFIGLLIILGNYFPSGLWNVAG